ncbi:FAD-binding protein [Phenylobacterium montanum]|uniref:FAD-binding protein n=1 Tax=Phenylobacterium montanum TaxID=2823693 RepID=A0A975G2V0_9CAUL|nr:FAD-binding protein [Caulobacter sp. S6]QUD90118.1 FAD-binding protein [Caulobacter sp. S6]
MILTPSDLDSLADAVADAAEAREPIEILGGGALRAMGRPVNAPRTLSTARLDKIHFYEPDELVISLEAGVPLDLVEQTLAASGQQLAFEPPDFSRLLQTDAPRTIGGTIAANFSGPRRFQAGAARDHLLGFTAVNGRGEVVKSGGRVVKNVTGYDLSKLVAGSWGTLAVLSTVTLKVLPRLETSASLVVLGAMPEAAVRLFARALSHPLDVTGAAWLPHGPWGERPAAVLRVEGFARSVAERLDLLADLDEGAASLRLDEAESEALWRGVRDGDPLAAGEAAIWRISVPPLAGPELLAAVPDSPAYLDWAGGLAWMAVPPEPALGVGRIAAVLARHGGHASMVRAPAELRAAIDAPPALPAPLAALTARVKDAFDPLRVLNPGRLYRDL